MQSLTDSKKGFYPVLTDEPLQALLWALDILLRISETGNGSKVANPKLKGS